MTTTQNILRIANTVQAINLVEHNLKASRKKQSTKSITKLGFENLIGLSLIKANSDFIEGI